MLQDVNYKPTKIVQKRLMLLLNLQSIMMELLAVYCSHKLWQRSKGNNKVSGYETNSISRVSSLGNLKAAIFLELLKING